MQIEGDSRSVEFLAGEHRALRLKLTNFERLFYLLGSPSEAFFVDGFAALQ